MFPARMMIGCCYTTLQLANATHKNKIDCLHLQLYRDSKDRYKQGQTKASLSLQHFLGVESGFTLDKESNTIAIICQDVIVVLAFDTRERLIQWQVCGLKVLLHVCVCVRTCLVCVYAIYVICCVLSVRGCHIDELRLKLINCLYVSCQIPCYVLFFPVWVHLPVFEIQILTWQII